MPDSTPRGRSPETPWEPQPRAPRAPQPVPAFQDDGWSGQDSRDQRDPREAREQRTRRGGSGPGPGGVPVNAPGRGRGSYPEDDFNAASPRGGRRGAPAAAPAYDAYDEGGDAPVGRSASRRGAPSGPSGSSRAGSRAAASTRSGSGQAAETLGQRALITAACALVPTLVISLLVHLLSGGGSSKSYAGIPLNMQLFKFMAIGFPMAVAAIAGALKWRRVEPFGTTLGYGVVAGLSWLGLLFMLQVKEIIPHLPPLLSVPVVVAGAFAAAGVLTAESTSSRGRYACLAGVLASHVAIVGIVVSIVLA